MGEARGGRRKQDPNEKFFRRGDTDVYCASAANISRCDRRDDIRFVRKLTAVEVEFRALCKENSTRPSGKKEGKTSILISFA